MERFLLKSKATKKAHTIGKSVSFFLVLLLPAIFMNSVLAEDKYPTKPITYVVGYAAGGLSEVSSRTLANAASKFLPQPIIIQTKPGGTSSVALSWLKSKEPDGYNIGLLPTGAVIQQSLRDLPYDAAKDFTHIMQYAGFHDGLVVQSNSPWKTFGELLDYAKANPEKIRYTSSGLGSGASLVMAQLEEMANVKFKHIPYEGSSQAITAILGGHVEACADSAVWKPHIDSGRLRLLAAFGQTRIKFQPNVPTLKELGYNVYQPNMLAVIGPKGLPSNVVETLHGAFKKALEEPDFLKMIDQFNMIVIYRNPQELAEELVKFRQKVDSLVNKLGLRQK